MKKTVICMGGYRRCGRGGAILFTLGKLPDFILFHVSRLESVGEKRAIARGTF